MNTVTGVVLWSARSRGTWVFGFRSRCQRGASLVEFALVAVLFFLLIFGIVEFGRAVWAYGVVAHSAREGVRYAIVRGRESGRAATITYVENYVRSRAAPLTPVNVTTSWIPDKEPGSEVQVRAQYNFTSLVPGLLPYSVILSSTSKMVISF